MARSTWLRLVALASLISVVGANPASARWPYTVNLGQLDTGPNAVVFDSAGNSYFAGTFSGTANVGGINYVSAGQQDLIVVKLDFDGDVVWTAVAGSAGGPSASGSFM